MMRAAVLAAVCFIAAVQFGTGMAQTEPTALQMAVQAATEVFEDYEVRK